MSLSWLITNAMASLLLPPMSLVLLGLIGLLLRRRYQKSGTTLVVSSVLLLVVLSTGAGSRMLVKPLEDRHVQIADPVTSGAQAIVVLGGGREILSPEDANRDRPSSDTLMRLRHGARLQRQTALPVLVSGGNPDGRGDSEAIVMARAMEEDFRIKVRWMADHTTAKNLMRNRAEITPIRRRCSVRPVCAVCCW